MIEFTWIKDIAPILIAVIVFILIYISLIKLKVPGSNVVLAILSALITLAVVASTSMVEYIFLMIPWFTVIAVVIFLTLLIMVFATGSVETFGKTLAWIGFVAVILIVFCAACDVFPTFYHLLPNTSDAYLSGALVDLKDWLYSNRILNSIFLIGAMFIVGLIATKN